MMRIWFVLCFMCVATYVLAAEKATPLASVLARVSTERLPQAIVILTDQQKKLDGCEHIADVQPTQVVTPYTVVLSADGRKVIQGDWMVRYSVNACGEKGLRMVRFTVGRDGVQLARLAPGETLADALLQADVMKSFFMASSIAMPKCVERPLIRETKVLYYPKDQKTAWREVWIGRMCGRDMGQVIDFIPNDKGTVFKMSVPKKSVK